ncbi:hypothetical protein ACXM1Q_000400 [Streptococcus sp. 10F2]
MNIGEIVTLFGAVVALLGGVSKLLSESRRSAETLEQIKKTADSNSEALTKVTNGTRTSLRYRLFHDMQVDIAKGYTTLERKREIAKLFESYKILDGNGEIELMYHEFVELPLKGDNDAPI